MKTLTKVTLGAGAMVLAVAGICIMLLVNHGFSAKDEPTIVEKFVARRFRNAAVPRTHKEARNPVPLTPEVLDRARAHFADHCALCHGNDGRGMTTMGQSLYPKAPDMWLPDTVPLRTQSRI